MNRRTRNFIRRTAPALCVLLIAASGIKAQRSRSFDGLSFQAKAGVGLGIGVLANYVDYGYTGSGGVALRPSEEFPEAAFVFTGGYAFYPGAQNNSGDFGIITAAVDFKLTPDYTAPNQFYLLAGIGYGHVSLSNAGPGQSLAGSKNSEGGPLAEAGAGIMYDNSHGPDYLMELKVTNIFSSRFGDYRFVTLAVGASF